MSTLPLGLSVCHAPRPVARSRGPLRLAMLTLPQGGFGADPATPGRSRRHQATIGKTLSERWELTKKRCGRHPQKDRIKAGREREIIGSRAMQDV
jgi:hypothetical protein